MSRVGFQRPVEREYTNVEAVPAMPLCLQHVKFRRRASLGSLVWCFAEALPQAVHKPRSGVS